MVEPDIGCQSVFRIIQTGFFSRLNITRPLDAAPPGPRRAGFESPLRSQELAPGSCELIAGSGAGGGPSQL